MHIQLDVPFSLSVTCNTSHPWQPLFGVKTKSNERKVINAVMYSEEIKRMIINIHSKLLREAQKGTLLCDVKDPLSRASAYTGINSKTIKAWIEVGLSRPPATKNKGRPAKLDSFDKDLVVRYVHKMIVNKEMVTLRKLKQRLIDDCGMEVSKSTL